MAAMCPKCGTPIHPFSIRSRFACTRCSAQLSGEILGPAIWGMTAWQFADIFFYPLFQQLAGDTWTGFFFRYAVSVWIGISVYMIVAGTSTINIAETHVEPSRQPQAQSSDRMENASH